MPSSTICRVDIILDQAYEHIQDNPFRCTVHIWMQPRQATVDEISAAVPEIYLQPSSRMRPIHIDPSFSIPLQQTIFIYVLTSAAKGMRLSTIDTRIISVMISEI